MTPTPPKPFRLLLAALLFSVADVSADIPPRETTNQFPTISTTTLDAVVRRDAMLTFGDQLRVLRSSAGMSMGELARKLAVSVPYISDVERGNRPPLTSPRIEQVATLFGVDSTALHAAAAASRGSFELPLPESASHLQRQVGASLMRGWSQLSDEDLAKIASVLKKSQGV